MRSHIQWNVPLRLQKSQVLQEEFVLEEEILSLQCRYCRNGFHNQFCKLGPERKKRVDARVTELWKQPLVNLKKHLSHFYIVSAKSMPFVLLMLLCHSQEVGTSTEARGYSGYGVGKGYLKINLVLEMRTGFTLSKI